MVSLEKVEMTEDELNDKKLHLEFCKLNKDESDLSLTELTKTMEKKIASRILQDDIARIKEDLKKKIVKDAWGNDVPATDADIDRMKITLDKFQSQMKLDLPERQIRYKIQQLTEAKNRIDAPEKQIKKLEKEIREKAYYMPARPKPSGIN
jgi:hypothetical protein